MARAKRKWIQQALGVKRRCRGLRGDHRKRCRIEPAHPGALHNMLNVPRGQKIPAVLLQEAARHPERWFVGEGAQARLRQRAQFALNVRRLGHRRRRSV